jgi:hypothetical protein
MCVLCLGEDCLDAIKGYLDTIDVAKASQEMRETDTLVVEIQEDNQSL